MPIFLIKIGQWIASKAWPYLAAAAGILLILAKARKSGADAERAKNLRNTVKAHETRSRIEDDIRRDPSDDRGLRGYYRD